MTFENDLEQLASIVKRSRNKKLKSAFVAVLESFNQTMLNYRLLLQSAQVSKEKGRWEVTLVQTHS
jgi:hypothetical protein